MKKILFTILISIIALFACSKQKNKSNISVINDFPGTTFSGYIDEKYEIEMELEAKKGNITGTYFYTKQKKKINISGEITKENKIILNESVDGENTGTFKGTINKDFVIKGNWTSGEKKIKF